MFLHAAECSVGSAAGPYSGPCMHAAECSVLHCWLCCSSLRLLCATEASLFSLQGLGGFCTEAAIADDAFFKPAALVIYVAAWPCMQTEGKIN